jgi:tRNA(adenine34) deaminase
VRRSLRSMPSVRNRAQGSGGRGQETSDLAIPCADPRPQTPGPSPIQLALAHARLGAQRGEVPVGAVIIDSRTQQVVTTAHNHTESDRDPTAHAEMIVIREACRLQNSPRLEHCDLYVTLEPCAMCAQAIAHARIRRLYFGAYDPKGGGVEHGARIFHQSTCHHRPEVVGGIEEAACAALLKDFFAARR